MASYSPLLGNPIPQYFDSAGAPYVGMRAFFYVSGTTTKQNTYTDSTGGTANTNPIIIGSDGWPTSGVSIYGDDSLVYKMVIAAPGTDDPPAASLMTVDVLSTTWGALRQDLASTTTDDGTKGFHLVYYPRSAREVAAGITPTNYEYEEGDGERYGIIADATATYTSVWAYGAGTDQGGVINTLLTAGITSISLPEGNIYITTPIVPKSGMVLTSKYKNYNATAATDGNPITRLIFNGTSTQSCIEVDDAAAEVSHMLIEGFRISDARLSITGSIPTSGWGIYTGTCVNRTHLKNLFVDVFPDGPICVGSTDNAKAGDNIIVSDVWIGPSQYHIDYDAETGNFTVGLTITGGTSGHTANITAIEDNGTTGRLVLSGPTGKFQDNEVITDSSTGSATSNGKLKANGVTIGNFNNICDISNIYCDGKGNAVTRNNGNALAGVITINSVKHEGGDAIFPTIQTAATDQVTCLSVNRRDLNAVPVVGPVSSRGAYFSIEHTKTDGTGRQAPIFWDASDLVPTTGYTYLPSGGPMVLYGTDATDNIQLNYDAAGDPQIILTRNGTSTIRLYTATLSSLIEYALASKHILGVSNTSATASDGILVTTAAGGGGTGVIIDRTSSDGRAFSLRRATVSKCDILYGTGSPEGVYTAFVGSTYHRYDGGTGTSFYVKESGTGNTGWVAK